MAYANIWIRGSALGDRLLCCAPSDPRSTKLSKNLDTTGFSRAVLQFQPTTKAHMIFSNTTGFSRVVLQFQPTTKAHMIFSNTTGFSCVVLQLQPTTKVHHDFFDTGFRPRVLQLQTGRRNDLLGTTGFGRGTSTSA